MLYNQDMQPDLSARTTAGASAEKSENSLLLTMPSGPKSRYRLAQFDDYQHIHRTEFPWQPPISMRLKARCSNRQHAGTWGFGLWNDPFSANLGIAGSARRLPVLPNCAWFFYASPPNHLEFYDRYPAQGFLAATFSSALIPAPVLLFGLALAPFLALPVTARLIRKLLRVFIKQDAAVINIDPTDWHVYRLDWLPDRVKLYVDENCILQTSIVPNGHLGLVLWVDNQFAAFPANGRLQFGTLANPAETSLEISDLTLK